MLAMTFNVGFGLQQAWNTLLTYLPRFIGAFLVLLVGYLVCRIIRAIVARLLAKVGLDRAVHKSGAASYVERFSPKGRPSALVAAVIFWVIFFFVLVAAVGNLRIAALTVFLQAVLGYLPNVIAALAILVVAAAIAGALGVGVHRLMGDTPTGRIARAIAPALIMAIAVFMALVQLRISAEIVLATYAGLMFALSLGSALAFGLGGREVAARMLNSAYENVDAEAIRRDIATGQARGRAEVEAARARSRQPRPGEPSTGAGPTSY